ncbi:MAG: pilus assembly protein N-terminal domain-containing protein [candidate division Zixibacteria bacterium]|nr:pilus assembly protein N-terminal domain-containing protein [candidate division Zixibacteria bacterium]
MIVGVRNQVVRLGLLAIVLSLLILPVSRLSGQPQLVRVIKGKSVVLNYTEKIKAVSVADEDVADVVSITATALVVIGKNEGVTSLFVWGESEKLTEYDIEVDRNTSGKQIVLDVQVAELNRSAMSEYGVDFLLIDADDRHIAEGTKTFGSYAGDVTPVDPTSTSMIASDGATTVLKWLGDTQEISTVIRAMQRDGEIKLIANPRLLSLSGEESSFLVGGEIPIPVAQVSSGGGVPSVTIEWKEYGVKLKFVPTIVDTNLINLKISPEVSSLDYANMISLGGYSIPALRTRKADVVIELNSQQSIVLGGLLATETFKTVKRVPILGHIPLLNFFFSRRETTTQETELLIVVSPRIIESVESEIIPPLPGSDRETE